VNDLAAPSGPLRRLARPPWRILAAGMALALLLATGLFYVLMAPSPADMLSVALTLGVTGLASVSLGYALFRRGWARSSSLTVTLLAAYLWAALVTLFAVWLLQRQMFFNRHDLILSGVLLLFAAVMATTFGLFVAASVTESLRRMADAAAALAGGDLSARAPITGRDEVARLGASFNEMAGRLEEAAERRRQLEAMRSDLIAWTSHDLRTPLTSIRARVEALHDGLVVDPAETRRYHAAILADVMALNDLIDDLFELAQLDSGGPALEMTPSSLADLISDCLERFDAAARQRGISLTGNVARGVDPVTMNAGKIGRVLNNLVQNALHHTPPGGQVSIRAATTASGVVTPGSVVVTVTDSGPGFAEADLPRVFEQFYRGEAARSRATGGAGLGLAIARGIVQAHGGRVWAANAPGGGAVVGFELPVVR
jgi:signal transduction histidine kinase